MTYVIISQCIDVVDRGCVDECPVDCIYTGVRKLYVNPHECIDCGACEPVCPVEAIIPDNVVPEADLPFVADDARFFYDPLPGRPEPLGDPGGAHRTADIGVDTPLVSGYPPAVG